MGAGVDESLFLSLRLGDRLNEDPSILHTASQIAADLVEGSLDMIQLVENLGSALTHAEAPRRELGVRMLSRVLAAVPPNLLTTVQLRFLSQFYADRLRDHHSTLPATLEGYLALVRAPSLPSDALGDFLAALFRDVSCASQQRADRANIYRILLHVLRSHPQYIRDAGGQLVGGVLAAVEGEREPRNLLLALELIQELTCRVDLGPRADDAFEQLACYFPVDFHPPPDEPAAVTRADIASALAPCLCAVPEFAEACLLLIVEKLDSNLRLAKLDSLQLLEMSCKTFEQSAYAPFVKTLWAALQCNIDNKLDEELSRHARRALTAVVARLARPDPHPALAQLTGLVLGCTMSALPTARTAPALNRVAAPALACCAAASSVATLLVRALMPAVAELLEREVSNDVRGATLNLLTDLHAHAVRADPSEPVAELAPRLCLDGLMSLEPHYHLLSLRGLALTLQSLKPELAPLLADTLARRLRHPETEAHPREALRCLRALAVAQPQCVSDRVLTEELRGESRCRALGALVGVEVFGDSCVAELLGSLHTPYAECAAGALLDGLVDSEMCSCEQLARLERRHGIVDAALAWFARVRAAASQLTFTRARALVTDTAARLPTHLQRDLMQRHANRLLCQCKDDGSGVYELEALVCSVRPEALADCDEAIDTALRLALQGDSAQVRAGACALVGAILNKADEGRTALLTAAHVACAQVPASDNLQLVAHITRALMLRGDPEFDKWLKKVVDGVVEDRREGAAAALELVASAPPRPPVAMHARVSPLHRQRLLDAFLALVPPPAASPEPRFARAAVAVLAAAPHALLSKSLQQTAGLVRAALEQDDAGVLSRALVVVHAALGGATPPDLAPAALLPRLLRLTAHAAMPVRLASLACVQRAAEARPTRDLLPLRDDAVARLAAPLDDPKRLVRTAAVRARSRWILIGAPGE